MESPRRLADAVLGVVHVELAGRGDQALSLITALELAGLGRPPPRWRTLHQHRSTENHTSSPALLYLRLQYALGALAQVGPLGDRQQPETMVQVLDVEHGDGLADLLVGV